MRHLPYLLKFGSAMSFYKKSQQEQQQEQQEQEQQLLNY